MDDKTLEEINQSRGLTAPRVTLADVNANIVGEYFTTLDKAFGLTGEPIPSPAHLSLGVFMICALVLRNGFIVTGESAPVSPENFDEALIRQIARDNAVRKIWPLMGYELKERLATAPSGSRQTGELVGGLDPLQHGGDAGQAGDRLDQSQQQGDVDPNPARSTQL